METMKYVDANISPEVLRAVIEIGFEDMTPIQQQAIPVMLEGRDIIGQAQTGTGKTAAFGIPLVMKVNPKNRNTQAIVLCPTRELAIQAAEEIRRFAKYMHGVRVLPVYGGQEIYKQINALKGGVQVIVGTPGRVMDHLRRKTIRTEDVNLIVLDEADEMLDMGFREDMESILSQMPQEHQTALFSATMAEPIMAITKNFQKSDAEVIKVVKEELTINTVTQYFYRVKKEYKEEVAARILNYYNLHRVLIFCNTKTQVDVLAENLKKRGFAADGLHGDLSQHQRDVVMNRFRNGILDILIATDVAARGIDVESVEGVINFDIPQDIEYYVHRIGRTGRAGKEGMSFTIINAREMGKLREIERVCNTKLTEQKVPSVKAVTNAKSEKILLDAGEVLAAARAQSDSVHLGAPALSGEIENSLEKYKLVIEAFCEKHGMDPLDIASALLKMEIGEEGDDIPDIHDSYKRFDRNRKGTDRRYQDRGRTDGRRSDGRRTDGRRTDGRKSDSRKPDGRRSEGKRAEERRTDNKRSEGRKNEGRRNTTPKNEARKPEGKNTEMKKTQGKSGFRRERSSK